MSVFQRVKEMLGLGGYEDDYDEDDRYEDDEDGAFSRSSYRSPYSEARSVLRVDREPDLDRARSASTFRGPDGAPQVRMYIVEPKTYAEAQSIADRFRAGTPVIMNLSATSPDISKRLLDFTSGLTYGLDGGLQKVSERVFMLTPANVDVSAVDRQRLRDEGLFTMDF